MLISRAFNIENVDANLEKGARRQLKHSRPAYEHPSALCETRWQKLSFKQCIFDTNSLKTTLMNLKFRNSMTMKTTKLLFACMLLLSGIFSFTVAHAQIVYTDVDPDLTITQSYTGSVVQGVDINNDGIIDINITAAWAEGFDPHEGYVTSKNVIAGCSAGSQLLMYYDVFGSIILAKPVSDTAIIDSASQTWSDIPFGAVLVVNVIGGDNLPFGDWSDTTDRFLGIRIPEGGDWLYGWVRVSVSQDSISFTIRDYAYNSTPNQYILPGQTITGIPETISSSSIALYPNPVSNQLTIDLGSNKQKAEVTITDVNGKIIYKTEASETQKIEVNSNDFAAGIYVVQVQIADFIETKKLIVVK